MCGNRHRQYHPGLGSFYIFLTKAQQPGLSGVHHPLAKPQTPGKRYS